MSWIRASSARGRARRACVACLVASACGPLGRTALAQTHAGDAAMAETLFNEAKRKMAAGDFATACPKLAESYRLDAGSGTLTALAVCHEHIGKTASAWTEFIEVVSEARQAGRADREKFAQQHIDALEPKLSKLTVVIDPAVAGLPGLEVRRDGTVLGQAGWGTAAPVDPGAHALEVKATGKVPWSSTVTVGPSGDLQTVTVARLEDVPPEVPAVAPSLGAVPDEGAAGGARPATEEPGEHPPASGGTRRTVGLVLGTAGLVAAGAGTYFGLQAISQTQKANDLCPVASACSSTDAVSKNDSAKSSALAADLFFGGALAAVGVGAILYFTAHPSSAPAPSTTAVHFRPAFTARGASFVMDTTW